MASPEFIPVGGRIAYNKWTSISGTVVGIIHFKKDVDLTENGIYMLSTEEHGVVLIGTRKKPSPPPEYTRESYVGNDKKTDISSEHILVRVTQAFNHKRSWVISGNRSGATFLFMKAYPVDRTWNHFDISENGRYSPATNIPASARNPTESEAFKICEEAIWPDPAGNPTTITLLSRSSRNNIEALTLISGLVGSGVISKADFEEMCQSKHFKGAVKFALQLGNHKLHAEIQNEGLILSPLPTSAASQLIMTRVTRNMNIRQADTK
ncbi:hypothetical protein ACKF11_13245 [Methylobacillus sp. Pita2]|uniref:hypothetical protein n=1 Tax=Methylobacillus sp. Pita2 TaxID=3383245 RepID=UPI0038B44EC7